jgi:hypothetical protein
MTIKKKIQTNAYPVRLDTDGLAGMSPIFRRKRDAVAYSKANGNAQVLKVGEVKHRGE